jgi:hypothetical protein
MRTMLECLSAYTFERYLPPATEAKTASDFSGAQNRDALPGTPGTTLKTKDFSPKINPARDPSVPGSKSGQPIENTGCAGCAGFDEVFSGKGKIERSHSAEDAPSDDQPDDIPTDRTCAQCRGEIDGTERLVSVNGEAVWLHAVCERFWLRAPEAGER